ncbi:MAG: hypothetical protein BWY95_02265 [Bacteroidetes bacterium ADurb.BinA104]|nr:MAG: hypothetical protein BWY95_02265 [Bacteroidetes bacterium ADurb.BinA104]
MNQQWIQDVHTRANKATLGPWCTVKEQSEIIGTCFKVRTAEDYPRSIASALVVGSDKALEQVETDFEFLAHARMDIPALLAAVEELRDTLMWAYSFLEGNLASLDLMHGPEAIRAEIRAQLGCLAPVIKKWRGGKRDDH